MCIDDANAIHCMHPRAISHLLAQYSHQHPPPRPTPPVPPPAYSPVGLLSPRPLPLCSLLPAHPPLEHSPSAPFPPPGSLLPPTCPTGHSSPLCMFPSVHPPPPPPECPKSAGFTQRSQPSPPFFWVRRNGNFFISKNLTHKQWSKICSLGQYQKTAQNLGFPTAGKQGNSLQFLGAIIVEAFFSLRVAIMKLTCENKFSHKNT